MLHKGVSKVRPVERKKRKGLNWEHKQVYLCFQFFFHQDKRKQEVYDYV